MWQCVANAENYIAIPPSDENQVIAEKLSNAFLKAGSTTPTIVTPEIAANLAGRRNRVIAVGLDSLKTIARGEGTSPVIGIFINRQVYEMADDLPATTSRKIVSLYSAPKPERQIALARILLGPASRIGMLYSVENSPEINEYGLAANRFDITIFSKRLKNDTPPRLAFREFEEMDGFMLLKDPGVSSPKMVDRLILLSYDINYMAAIGATRRHVQKGALATTYSSIEDTVASVIDVTKKLDDVRAGYSAIYPMHYSVTINKYVLQSLGLHSISEKNLKQQIDQALSTIGLNP